MSFLFQPTRHAVDEPEQAWDPAEHAAGRIDGTATIVGNSGGWWLRCTGPGDMSDPMPSARDALAHAPKPAAR